MSTELILDDIITDHRERMVNIKKYYPFFRLCDVSFAAFKEGRYAMLDMGYITMAVLRYFLEENNFKDKDVTYPEYLEFMGKCLKRDFGLNLDNDESKEVADFVFDKLKNEGRPFVFEYFDPVDKKKKSLRLHLIESRIADNTVWYSISSDAIEFYLDTKEIKDESKISVEQLLLEKLIHSKNFKGGTDVVRRINSEVERLKLRKNEVAALMASDIFAGIEAYEQFVDTGMKWFEDEQRLFVKNSELIEASLKKAEEEYKNVGADEFARTVKDIYVLETELHVAMNKHSELLRTCTDLQILADEIIKKTKISKLRNSFNFKNGLEHIIKADDVSILERLVMPFMGLNLRKNFNVMTIEQMLTYLPSKDERGDKIVKEEEKNIVFNDELEEERINNNHAIFEKILKELVEKFKETDLEQYGNVVKKVLGDKATLSADFYSYVAGLCQMATYEPDKAHNGFRVQFIDGAKNIEFFDGFEMTNVKFVEER